MTSNTTSKSGDKVQHNVDGNILAEYTIHKRIGKGAYGIVYKAYDKNNKQYVAIKKIFEAFRNKTDAQRTYREILFLKSFQRHPNIITMLDIYKAVNNKDLYVVFEYMENDLNKVIRDKILKDVHIRYIMFQLCNGLSYIHACKVMHRDLKPSNILIDKSCSIKIGDLGLARSLSDSKECLTEYIATRWYRAPEILISNRRYTHHVDIWSLGCILAEMLQSKPLFPGASTSHQLQLIVNLVRPNPPHADKFYAGFKNKPEEAVDLLNQILVLNPSERPETDQILEHNYVSKYFPSATHVIPQVTPHTVVLDIDDNNQLEINDYQDKLYDIVKSCKKKKSVKRLSKGNALDNTLRGHYKIKDAISSKYTSSEKENQQNNNNTAPSYKNVNVNTTESVQHPGNCENNSTDNLTTANLSEIDHVQNKKDYISYNKQNVVNFTNDKTKARKQHAHTAVANITNQETPVLVTSKTYNIDKSHVKHVSKTWLDPVTYEPSKSRTKDKKIENIKNSNNTIGKYNYSEKTLYEPKLDLSNHNELKTNNDHCTVTNPTSAISCEDLDSILENQTPYCSEYNFDGKKPQSDMKYYQNVQDINNKHNIGDTHLIEPSLPYCPSPSQKRQTRHCLDTCGNTYNPCYGINVKIPQVRVKKNKDIMRMSNVPNGGIKNGPVLATRQAHSSKCMNLKSIGKTPDIGNKMCRRQMHGGGGFNFYLTNGETNSNISEYEIYENGKLVQACIGNSTADGKANKNNRHVKANVTSSKHTNGDIHSVKNSIITDTYEDENYLAFGNTYANSIQHFENGVKKCKNIQMYNKNDHKYNNGTPQVYSVASRQHGSETKNDMYVQTNERRYSDNSVQSSYLQNNEKGEICNGENHRKLKTPQNNHRNYYNELLDKHSDKDEQKQYLHKNCVFDKIMNYYNNNSCYVTNTYVKNKNQTHKRAITSDTKQYLDGSNEDAAKDNANLANSEGKNIFQCFKTNKTKVKKYFDYNAQISDKLNNMHKLSVLNFNVTPISMDDSDINGDLDEIQFDRHGVLKDTELSDNHVRLLKPDLNEYVTSDIGVSVRSPGISFCMHW